MMPRPTRACGATSYSKCCERRATCPRKRRPPDWLTVRCSYWMSISATSCAPPTLHHGGLAKHYRQTEGNRPALKGQLRFSEHVRQNSVQQARFYVRHQTFDPLTPLNALLRMALELAADVAQSAALRARAQALLLAWPNTRPVPVPTVVPALTRRTERYRPALKLALLLLHRLTADVQAGATEAVALLFEMPRLFEAYVGAELRRAARSVGGLVVQTQAAKTFWNETVPIRPDVVLSYHGRTQVLDTKWKVPRDQRPTAADLQQLYAYCHLWHATTGWLLYPATGRAGVTGIFSGTSFHDSAISGRVAFAEVVRDGKLNRTFGAELVAHLGVE